MRIQHIQTQQQNKIQNKKTQPKFNGAVDVGLRFLATNQGIGANLTDLSFMVIPRIASYFKRGPAACLETTRREASGTTNHSLIGVYGLLGGMVTATVLGLKNKFNVNLNKTFAAPETINILAEYKYEQLKSKQEQ